MTWKAISFQRLARLLPRGWSWVKKGRRLQLRSPKGSLWDFKLQGKPYVRRSTDTEIEKERS